MVQRCLEIYGVLVVRRGTQSRSLATNHQQDGGLASLTIRIVTV